MIKKHEYQIKTLQDYRNKFHGLNTNISSASKLNIVIFYLYSLLQVQIQRIMIK